MGEERRREGSQVGRVGVYDMTMTRKDFVKEIFEYPDNHPWIKCKSANVTLDVLVDIFSRWSIAFDMYDSRIMRRDRW